MYVYACAFVAIQSKAVSMHNVFLYICTKCVCLPVRLWLYEARLSAHTMLAFPRAQTPIMAARDYRR